MLIPRPGLTTALKKNEVPIEVVNVAALTLHDPTYQIEDPKVAIAANNYINKKFEKGVDDCSDNRHDIHRHDIQSNSKPAKRFRIGTKSKPTTKTDTPN